MFSATIALIHLIFLLYLPCPAISWSINNFMITGGHFTQPYVDLIEMGIQVGAIECQKQFKYSLWNCPRTVYDNLLNPSKRHRVRPTKEVAFMHSIMNAAIVHTIVTACQSGQHKNCTCHMDKSSMNEQNSDNFAWKGCQEALKVAVKITRDFVDKKERSDTWGSINIHNNHVGRQSIERTMKKICKCHGISGSCSMKSCWMKFNDFHWIGKRLKFALKTAKRVEPNRRPDDNIEDHFKTSLIYVEQSPNYCYPNQSLGSVGTLGRVCSDSSPQNGSSTNHTPEYVDDKDNCSKLCRRCGYKVKRIMDKNSYNCNCKFEWCCQVKCEICPPRILSICSTTE